jgi:thiamine kinase-like enzyme
VYISDLNIDGKLAGKGNNQMDLLAERFHNLSKKLDHLYNQKKSSSSFSNFDHGILFGFDNVLCHNDLLSGNILLSNETPLSAFDSNDENTHPKISLIDYEYASYNHRGFDIGNHFFGMHCHS